jgi:hypothetical protein
MDTVPADLVKRVQKAKDFYQVLGLEPSVQTSDIRSRYKVLARALHPDKNPDASATAAFHVVRHAAEVLCDPERRPAYDDRLKHGTVDPPSVEAAATDSSSSSLDDLAEELAELLRSRPAYVRWPLIGFLLLASGAMWLLAGHPAVFYPALWASWRAAVAVRAAFQLGFLLTYALVLPVCILLARAVLRGTGLLVPSLPWGVQPRTVALGVMAAELAWQWRAGSRWMLVIAPLFAGLVLLFAIAKCAQLPDGDTDAPTPSPAAAAAAAH